MVKALAHVCFRVHDLERSLVFYRDHIGLEVAFERTDEHGRLRGAYIHVGGRSFIEMSATDVVRADPQQSYQHFCLEVDDIKQTIVELRSRGVEVTDMKIGNDRSWQAWLSDPDGNRIELHQYTPESRQAQSLLQRADG
jgi:catechol 2,3-dioxygenase-like lactoylglutathione lyase family enzyme